jgi:ketosteroid isomerase-like protein
MSKENVETVREAFDGFNAFMRGELTSEAAAEYALLDPQVELDWHDQRTPDTPQHVGGAQELIGLWERFRGAWVDLAWEPIEFIEAPGDRVLTPIRQPSRGRESGVPMEVHFFCVWTIRDGRLRKIELFRHRAEALEAAGLRE